MAISASLDTGSLELPVYGWPAQLDDSGLHIEPAAENVRVIAPAIIVAVKPLHGGLPTRSLGLRPGVMAKLESKGMTAFPPPDCLVVFRLSEFLAWAKAERRNGKWASQQDRGMKVAGRRGRPQRTVDRAIALARSKIDEGEWNRQC